MLTCLHCGQSFEPDRPGRTFCSAECRTAFAKPGVTAPPKKIAATPPKRPERLSDDTAAEQLRVVLETLGWPYIVLVAEVRAQAQALKLGLATRLNRGRMVPFWFEDNGYQRLPPARRRAACFLLSDNWAWNIGGSMHVIYARAGLGEAAAVAAVRTKQKEAQIARGAT